MPKVSALFAVLDGKNACCFGEEIDGFDGCDRDEETGDGTCSAACKGRLSVHQKKVMMEISEAFQAIDPLFKPDGT